MSKYIAIYVIVLAGLGVAAMEVSLSECSNPQGPFEFAENQNETEQKTARYVHFSRVMQPTIVALRQGKMSLRDATAKVYSAALTYSPVYVVMLDRTESGKTVEEKIARNLIGHVGDGTDFAPNAEDRVAELEMEFRQMCAEPSTRE